MNKSTGAIKVVVLLLLLSVIIITGCMREPGVCNYNGVCQDDETDNCYDCQDVLGRGLPFLENITNTTNSTNITDFSP